MLQAAYLRNSRFCQQSSAWQDGVLGRACFGEIPPADVRSEAPLVAVHAPPLDQSGVVGEIWRTADCLASGHSGPISYRHDDTVLFGCCAVDEADFAAPHPQALPGTALQRATEFTYRSIVGLIDRLQFPFLLRVWNYIPQINRETDGMERYRQFNIGRQGGLKAGARPTTGDVPPASALGVSHGALTVYFLAGRTAPIAIENPRQVSAFHYPRQYGARSPTFSRAGLIHLGEQEILFVSGTASSVGHRSIHIDDAAAQTRESLLNIEAVVTEANRISRQTRFELGDLHYKIYVRHPLDLDTIRREVQQAVGVNAHAVYLQADICRSDLLVEIEASGGHPMEFL
jgi:enamine deaminase RidA (YjgF/YER057c/UK114 family)